VAQMFSQQAQVNRSNSMTGVLALIFGIISIFFFAPIFVPLALIFSVAALTNRQWLYGLVGLGTAAIGFITSPILMGILAVATLTSLLTPRIPSTPVPVQTSSQTRAPPVTTQVDPAQAMERRLQQVRQELPTMHARSDLRDSIRDLAYRLTPGGTARDPVTGVAREGASIDAREIQQNRGAVLFELTP
jgi:hypothetical protein